MVSSSRRRVTRRSAPSTCETLPRPLRLRSLVALHVRSRVQVTEHDLHAAYTRWRAELEAQDVVDLRIIVLPLPASTTSAWAAATEALANGIVEQAKAGADFCALVRQYSHPGSTARCGPPRWQRVPRRSEGAHRAPRADLRRGARPHGRARRRRPHGARAQAVAAGAAPPGLHRRPALSMRAIRRDVSSSITTRARYSLSPNASTSWLATRCAARSSSG